MNLFKNNLDERQELTLLKIEHNACWFAFWALLSSLFIQQFIFGFELRNIIGEWIVFMCMAVYLTVACMRNGIWSRSGISPNFLTNFIISLCSGIVTGAIVFAILMHNISDREISFLALGGTIAAVITFVMCLAALSFASFLIKRKQQKLEEEIPDDIENI